MEDVTYQKIKQNIKKLLNIDLNQYKSEQMQRRLNSWLIRVDGKNWDDYFFFLSKNPADTAKFRDYLTINVSEFFRDQTDGIPLEKPFFRGWSKNCPSTIPREVKMGCESGAPVVRMDQNHIHFL